MLKNNKKAQKTNGQSQYKKWAIVAICLYFCLSFCTDGLCAVHKETKDDNVTVSGIAYHRSYRVYSDSVSSSDKCGGGACPSDHYCVDGWYPDIWCSGLIIRSSSRCRNNSCGSSCDPRCGWADVMGCEGSNVYTCASSCHQASGGKAWCLEACTPTLTCANYPGNCGAALSNGCTNTLDCSNYCPAGNVNCCSSGVLYTEVMRVKCPTGVAKIAGTENMTITSKLNIRSNGKRQKIRLVPSTAPNASCLKVRIDGSTETCAKML